MEKKCLAFVLSLRFLLYSEYQPALQTVPVGELISSEQEGLNLENNILLSELSRCGQYRDILF